MSWKTKSWIRKLPAKRFNKYHDTCKHANSFAVQFGVFIEIETSCQIIVLLSKLKIIPNLCSISLPRIRS